MDLEYDRKFKDMKKYIPFLESMIRRLESTGTASSSNPRQAQLDKIRSLRDLLLDQKKRMKMVNLLKCEQVLVNLYAKVEQKDTLPGISNAVPLSNSSRDLDSVRKKLKSLNTKSNDDPDTLPEIARASETEAICTPGSKEPALFQRRPNLEVALPSSSSKSPVKTKSSSRRSYTRVLVSPDSSSKRWSTSGGDTDNALFSRRSPQNFNKNSPFYHKKERKKSSKEKETTRRKDLNITLNVPQDSLDSLNTDDILSRIIHCSDSDVDISTLRELRSQILGELQKTGSSDDISDLILKSYKPKKKTLKSIEIEEGELSDSESEAIESVYGNLKIKEKGILNSDVTNVNKMKTDGSDSSQRKIQICLVFNSDNEVKRHNDEETAKQETELEMFNNDSSGDIIALKSNELNCNKISEIKAKIPAETLNTDIPPEIVSTEIELGKVVVSDEKNKNDTQLPSTENLPKPDKFEASKSSFGFKANFYKPMNEDNTESTTKDKHNSQDHETNISEKSITSERHTDDSKSTMVSQNKASTSSELNKSQSNLSCTKIPVHENVKIPEEIPLLGDDSKTVQMTSERHKKSKQNVSEIDILQALKNEILSESIAIPGSEETPALHQPKILKVSNAQEITKKRISIEKYKAKSSNVPNTVSSLALPKKSSLNLTEKEYERFNFSKIALDDSSDEEAVKSKNISSYDIYGDLAPKSPDDDNGTMGITPPVIIPDEPIKEKAANLQSDVDMRKKPLLSNPHAIVKTAKSFTSESSKNKVLPQTEDKYHRPVDPRVRQEFNRSASIESPNPYMTNSDRNRTLAQNPSYPNMTPSRTPLHQTYEIDAPSSKHVYAPLLANPENSRENSDSHLRRKVSWEPNSISNDSADFHGNQFSDPRTGKHFDRKQNSYSRIDSSSPLGHMLNRSDCPSTPNPSFERSEMPMTPSHPFGRSEMPMTPSHPFGRSERPMTPSHPFGRSEMPMTPSHPFGRSEMPMTPSHPFGRSEMPMTPSHPFGRSEMPMTPSHPFGRNEIQMTPTHSFGRSELTSSHAFGRGDIPITSSHPFGRNEVPMLHGQSFGRNDPRLNRSELDSKRNCEDKTLYSTERDFDGGKDVSRFQRERSTDRGFYHDNVRERRSYREHSVGRNDQPQKHERSSDHNRFNTERSVGRNECDTYDQRGRQYQREYGEDRYNSRQRGEDSYKSREVTLFNERQIPGERNVGRNTPYEDLRYQRTNTGRTYGERTKGNTLSIEQQSGRSFEIDTRVSNTFQNNIETEKFNERRRRSASVGRGINVDMESNIIYKDDFHVRRQRASSVGRALKQNNDTKIESSIQSFSKMQLRKDFRRCSSVGRDLKNNTSDRSLSDIKADFALYQMQENAKKNKLQPGNSLKRHSERSRKKETIIISKQVNNKFSPQTNYSPRKNYRDPRMRRDQQIYDKKNKYDKYSKDPYVKKNSGIVYSSDNIAKGAIMGPGYGVKNYKIPKLKRPAEEECLNDSALDTKDNTQINKTKTKCKVDDSAKNQESLKICEVKSTKSEIRQEDQINVKKRNNKDNAITLSVDLKSETRVTRAKLSNAVQSNSKDIESPTMTRKNKKGVIYDTDSDSEQKVEKEENKHKTTCAEISKTVSEPEENINKIEDIKTHDEEEALLNNPEVLDSSFGIEDLDIFSDNMVSDSNINAILEDLDNDINTIKKYDLDKDVQNSLSILTKGATLHEISNLTEEELKKSDAAPKVVEPLQTSCVSPKVTRSQNEECSMQTASKTSIEVPKKLSDSSANISQIETTQHSQSEAELPCQNKTVDTNSPHLIDASSQKVINNDTTVSTSDAKSLQRMTEMEQNKSDSEVPDSFIKPANESKKLEQDGLPDSTNEISNEDSTGISSTLKDESKAQSSKDAIDSFGNLLTILQDKTKIKQLLSMLGDQGSDSEKIKKKLEKISEIVTDDEDTKDSSNQMDDTEKIPSETLSHDIMKIEATKENEKLSMEHSNVKDVMSSKTDSRDSVTNIDKKTQNNDNKLLEQENEKEPIQDSKITESPKKITESPKKNTPIKNEKAKDVKKKGKVAKKTKGKNKNLPAKAKRITRSTAAGKGKKKRGELQKLQDDIKEMFISDEILNATGIRMCRLAKLLDDKPAKKDDTLTQDVEPVVVLEKISNKEADSSPPAEKSKTKPGPKSKTRVKPTEELQKVDTVPKSIINRDAPLSVSYRPGPKSKTKRLISLETSDPYAFETESSSTSIATIDNHSENSSDSESESLASSKSFGSTEPLIDLKKKKRKSRGWKVGVIKPKNKKKPADKKVAEVNVDSKSDDIVPETEVTIPDLNCFTDKKYCFSKDVTTYSCRLCHYNGDEIVNHYKKNHPHSEVPLSRMQPSVAKTAIQQCGEVYFQAISKMPTNKYVCRFCFKEFAKKKNLLEIFFWHVVSVHTGEYKQICSECVNFNQCPFNLDIPPPPKDVKGQLIGYICDKCNFTQISLENLKLHVILRHNDEQTAVYTINLSDMTRGCINQLVKNLDMGIEKREARVLRSSLSSKSVNESTGDDRSEVTDSGLLETVENEVTPSISELNETENSNTFQTKISFENDDTSEISQSFSEDVIPQVKEEPRDSVETLPTYGHNNEQSNDENNDLKDVNEEQVTPNDILNCPHFKINFTGSGSKEYVCCINGDMHYRSPLLISFKKHVQKHVEHWDGYCFVCKVIITPQGKHSFIQLLQHFIDVHMDNFPIEDKNSAELTETNEKESSSVDSAPRSYINVRPLAQLLSATNELSNESEVMTSETIPIIENVRSLGTEPLIPVDAVPALSSTFQYNNPPIDDKSQYEPMKYEEAQAEIMSKKHRVVLETMMAPDKLVRVFKCAGRFCSYTTDSTEEALIHASTHQRVGGENALKCAYCDFDASDNAIDLVMHIFKFHTRAPYLCGHCFYRADASQLVGAHILRIHGSSVRFKNVYKSTRPPPLTTEDVITRELKREEACLYYVCNNGVRSLSIPCKFKTFTPGKFIDHLLQRHPSDNVYSCYLCSEDCAAPLDLVDHLKSHGLKRYQCLWCVFGAEDEPELLAHASEKHPWKPPQGYIRIVTNKEGSDEYRVLPKALLNKNKVPFVEVEPSSVVENATREAERSIDLEKLIGNLLTDPLNSLSPVVSESSVVTMTQNETVNTNTANSEANVDIPPEVNLSPSTSNPISTGDISTPVLKTEALDTAYPNVSPEVICLDSDEDEGPAQLKVVSTKLFKCSKCKNLCKTLSGFRRHLATCYNYLDTQISCFHCLEKLKNVGDLVIHIVKEHSIGDKYCCSLCKETTSSLNTLKKHMKQLHKVDKPVIKTHYKANHIINYAMEPPQTPKTPTKCFKYGPQDISALPINPILDVLVFCALCEFSTKVRLNMVRHLQLHAEQQPVAQTAPVNPVPHLETNEKYFDKMLNLASSSISTKTSKSEPPSAAQVIPPEAAFRYPKYIPDRQRYACGARGCSYISVDEGMFKCHWETLHNGVNEFTCLHCPPNQQLDPNKPLNALRIITHLKMHDASLYACSSCPYYHFKRQIVDKHVNENHPKKGCQVMVVRDENTSASLVPLGNTSMTQLLNAPTMDLKPWQCGLCQFKSMLRQEINDHCYKLHQSKMQYKCAHCPYRASTLDNVNKHQKNSHPDKDEDIFYYYYREGSIPNETDGTLRWMKQQQKLGLSNTQVKTEVSDSSLAFKPSEAQKTTTTEPTTPISIPPIDLNIVKQEIAQDGDVSVEALCARFGQFCEPNGIKYKCPLCRVIMADTVEQMRSHLYEELRYRKWACSICSYKAFHKTGLNDHMLSEHKQTREAVELPKVLDIEVWVAKFLEHQTTLIEKNRENLKAQTIQTPPVDNSKLQALQKAKEPTPTTPTPTKKYRDKELEIYFGQFGSSVNMHFCCPKCPFKTLEVAVMQDHLESELSKIRWYCSNCPESFPNYHEAQFHCRVVHTMQCARPKEALRDATVRADWVSAVIASQKSNMNCPAENIPSTSDSISQTNEFSDAFENSLLAVRYEERVPTPEEAMLVRRKRPANDDDSEDERLVNQEPTTSDSKMERNCPHCSYEGPPSKLHNHLVRHFNLKPITCAYCRYMGYKFQVLAHLRNIHPFLPPNYSFTPIPSGKPCSPLKITKFSMSSMKDDMEKNQLDDNKLLCLVCEKQIIEAESKDHMHNQSSGQFAKKYDVVVKCGQCFALRKDIESIEKHFEIDHKSSALNYAFYKIKNTDEFSREVLQCGNCVMRFQYLNDLKNHHESIHRSLQLSFTTECVTLSSTNSVHTLKRKSNEPEPVSKKTARKSTAKLPKTVARKSTTKLPLTKQERGKICEEFSFYGTKPLSLDKYENVTTLMPFCNTLMPFKLKQLSEILKINPIVLVEDVYKCKT